VKVELAPEAVADLAALFEYLHQRNPQAAATTADGVLAVIDRLAAGEFEGPECELRRTRERVRSTELAGAAVPGLLPPGGGYARRVADLSLGWTADHTVSRASRFGHEGRQTGIAGPIPSMIRSPADFFRGPGSRARLRGDGLRGPVRPVSLLPTANLDLFGRAGRSGEWNRRRSWRSTSAGGSRLIPGGVCRPPASCEDPAFQAVRRAR
jgi:ParE-like toxin of type II ParDE toxin-antitoxin system